jgi:hypothetical protein
LTTGFARCEVMEALSLADGEGISSSGVIRMKILGPGGDDATRWVLVEMDSPNDPRRGSCGICHLSLLGLV